MKAVNVAFGIVLAGFLVMIADLACSEFFGIDIGWVRSAGMCLGLLGAVGMPVSMMVHFYRKGWL